MCKRYIEREPQLDCSLASNIDSNFCQTVRDILIEAFNRKENVEFFDRESNKKKSTEDGGPTLWLRQMSAQQG